MVTSNLRQLAGVFGAAARQLRVEPYQFVLSVRMALWVVAISILARATSLSRAQKIASFSLRARPRPPSASAPARLGHAIDQVLGVDCFVFRRSCWKRAMVLHRFLALEGIQSRINFGVRRDADGALAGHAWLEHQGRPLLEQHAGAYVVAFSLPLEPRSSANLATLRAVE